MNQLDKMDQILDEVYSQKKSAGDLILEEAREILGQDNFDWAMNCPLDVLLRYFNHPEDILGVGIGYERVYYERKD